MRFVLVTILSVVLAASAAGQAGVSPGAFAAFALGDPDGNGKPDLLFAGNDPSGNSGIAEWTNEQGFNLLSLPVAPLATSVGWCDLNNDGRQDYFMFGSGRGACFFYIQDSTGHFTPVVTNPGTTVLDPDVTVIDADNDGDDDLFVSGWDAENSKRFSRLYLNDGLADFSLAPAGLIEKGYGSSSWADVNGDGLPDLLLNGDGDQFGDDGSFDIYRLYTNNGDGSFTEKQTFGTCRQISVGDGSRFADWNNDGFADIILTGWSKDENRQVTALYLNDGTGQFTRDPLSDQLPGVSESSVEVADMNHDRRIDLLLTGYSGTFSRNVSLLITNDIANDNTAPGAPVSAGVILDDTLTTLNWGSGTDDLTPGPSLSYHFYLYDIENMRWLVNPLADTSLSAEGYRELCGPGNAGYSHQRIFYRLPESKYRWGVQSLDAAYLSSPFRTGPVFAIKDSLALRARVNEAKSLLSTAVAGDQPGMATQDAIDHLAEVLALIDPWVSALDRSSKEISDTLTKALDAYLASVIAVDHLELSTRIEEAQALLQSVVAGSRNGDYPEALILALESELASARVVLEDALAISELSELSGAQQAVDNAALKLATAIATLIDGQISVDYSPLNDKIAEAISLYESSGTGLCNGCFPESAFGNLSVAIEIAVNLSMTDLSGQEVDAAVSDLQQAMNSFLDLMIIVDKTILGELIDSANYIHDQANVDDYAPGAKFELKKAINEALTVYNNSSATSFMVNSAVSALKLAITRFLNSAVSSTESNSLLAGIYPNPADREIHISGSEIIDRARILDLSGRILLEYKPAAQELSLDLSSIEEGCYLLLLHFSKDRFTATKIIVRR